MDSYIIQMQDSFKALMPLIIPEGGSDYFEMTHYSKGEGRLDIFLEEMNVIPDEFKTNSLLSKGFLIPLRFKIFLFVANRFICMLNVVDGLIKL